MIWLFLIIGTLLVSAIAITVIAVTVEKLRNLPFPAVFEVDDAVDWIAERLPPEVASQLRQDEVLEIIGWWLASLDTAGLASEYGQELGDVAIENNAGKVIADLDGIVDDVVVKGLSKNEPIDELAVVVVLDMLMVYLTEIGAIGRHAVDPDNVMT